MLRLVSLTGLIWLALFLSGCGLSPKDSVLKKPSAQREGSTPSGQVQTENALEARFKRVEELYGKGVVSNQESDWVTAQTEFEKSLEILYLMEVDEADTTAVECYNRLLREIAYEYKNSLVYLGELEDDTSQILFLEQFYDLQTFKNQDFAVSTDSEDILHDESGETVQAETELDFSQVEFDTTGITHDMPIEWNWRVKQQLEYVTRSTKGRFQEYLHRSGKYIDFMREIIRKNGLPEDLVYLPLIESGFNPKAYSWAHASGPWQFISSTGKNYGLNRNWWYDERRDFVKSTQAACDYLKFLHQMFGDWKLALAAYNGGEGRVSRTIKRQRTRDFWRMDLRKQTEDYVPRYMAAVMVAKEPEKFGFQQPAYQPLVWDLVETEHCLDLKEIAKKLEIDVSDLRELNPELLRDVTPPGMHSYELRIPAGKKENFWTHYQDLSSKGATIFAQHKVRRGETLGKIAQKYRTTVSALAELNNMPIRKPIRAGQHLTVPITAKGNYSASYASSGAGSKSRPSTSSPYFVYQVKRYDSLTELARKFGTSVNAIRKLNGFSSRRHLFAGEKIRIPDNGYASKNTIDRLTENLVIHIVRDGDTLWKIAQSYGTSLSNLLSWNRLADTDSIFPGQKLKIYKN